MCSGPVISWCMEDQSESNVVVHEQNKQGMEIYGNLDKKLSWIFKWNSRYWVSLKIYAYFQVKLGDDIGRLLLGILIEALIASVMPMSFVYAIALAESALALFLLRNMCTSPISAFLTVAIANLCTGFLCLILALRGYNRMKKLLISQPLLLASFKVQSP